MEVAKGKYNGVESRFVLYSSCTEDERNMLLDVLSAKMYDKFLVIEGLSGKVKDALTVKMAEFVYEKDAVTVSNGHFLLPATSLIGKIEKAESISELSNIYKEFKFEFSAL